MRGQILVFNKQKEAVAIVATDGQRFLFHVRDWQDVVAPEGGMSVEFKPNEHNRAQQVQLALPDTSMALALPQAVPLAQRPKSKPVLTLLTLFLGFFGAHRFYMGAWGWGRVQSVGMLLLLAILAALLVHRTHHRGAAARGPRSGPLLHPPPPAAPAAAAP